MALLEVPSAITGCVNGSTLLGLHTLLFDHQDFRNLFYTRVKPWSYLLREIY
jgi:hypothetical protein